MIKQTVLLSAISLTLIVSAPASANQQRGGWWNWGNWGQRNQAPAPAAPAPTTTHAAGPTTTPTGTSHKEHEKEDAALHKEESGIAGDKAGTTE
jgi:hypothetical protein